MTYSELTRRYFDAAPGAGILTGPGVARGAAGSRALGTWVQFDLRTGASPLTDRRIESVRFLCFGCPHTIAVSAWVAEQGVGRPLRPALPEAVHALQRRFGVPVEKLGRLLLVEDAWLAVIAAGGS